MTTDTMTLTDFLLARIADDEAVARPLDGYERPHYSLGISYTRDGDEYMVEIDPARVLAECEAKRRIIAEVTRSPMGVWRAGESSPWADRMLGILALPYADHPDYRDKWKP